MFFVVAVGIVVFLSAAHPAYAQGVEIQGYLYKFIAWLLEIIAGFLGSLILSVIDLLIVVSGYNNFIDADVVNTGWVLVRDVANMFYIFVMLVIAFGTMLKLEAYTWTKLLPRLIITAVVVNFSRTIMGVIIDFAQVIMITFVNGYAAAAGGNFAQGFSLDAMFKIKQGAIAVGTNTDFKIIIAYLLATVMLAIALVVVSVFLAILLGRIITIWILVILSPIAFLMGTFPKGQEYYSKWWKQFQNAVIVGPVLAFFLWLSLATMSGGNSWGAISGGSALGGRELDTKDLQIGSSEAGGIEKVGSFVVSIAMLMIGLQMTQELGVMGSGLASGAASAIKSTATKVARAVAVPAAGVIATGGVGALGVWSLAGSAAVGGLANLGIAGAVKGTKKVKEYVGKSIGTRVGTRIMESPLGKIPAYFTEGARRREEELKRAMTEAQAKERMRFQFKRDGFTPDYMRLSRQQRATSAAKDFGTIFEDNVSAATLCLDAMDKKFTKGDLGHEGNDVHRGIVQSTFQAKYVDDVFELKTEEAKEKRKRILHDVVGYEYEEGGETKFTNDKAVSDAKGGKRSEEADDRARMVKSTENYNRLILRGTVGDTKDVDDILFLSPQEFASKTDKDKAEIERRIDEWSAAPERQDGLGLLADMKETSKKDGHYENMGLGAFNDRIKGYRANMIHEQAAIINGSLIKADLVEKAKVNPHSLMQMDGGNNNRPMGMSTLGKLTQPSWLSGEDETSLSRNFRGRTANVILGNGPAENPLQDMSDPDKGWIQVHEEYINDPKNHDDLKEFLGDPLLLKALFGKVSGTSVGTVGAKMDKLKIVVGGKSATLAEILRNGGDLKASLKDMDADDLAQVTYQRDYDEDKKRVADGKMRTDEFRSKYAAGPPPKSVKPAPPSPAPKSEESAGEVADEIGTFTGQPIANLDKELRPLVDDFRAAFDKLGEGELKKTLTNLISALNKAKSKDDISTILEKKAHATDSRTSLLTPQARTASLLLELVRRDNKKIIDLLTSVSKGTKPSV